MKNFLTLILLILSVSAFSQTPEKSKWKLGGKFAPELATSRNAYAIHNIEPDMCHMATPFHKRTLSYSVGIVTQYSITKKLDLGIGASFAKRNIADLCTTDGSLIIIGPHPEWPSFSLNPKGYFTMHYVEVPIFTRYEFLDGWFGIHTEAGVTTRYILDQARYNNTQFVLTGQVGFGVNLELYDSFNLSYTTYYNRKLTDFTTNTVYWNSNRISFELKGIYQFNKR